jgi:hypothetical protein
MGALVRFIRWEVLTLVLGLAGIVLFELLGGQINTKFLLSGSGGRGHMAKDGSFSPARVQLLLSTLGLALYYLMQVTNNPTSGLPDVPESWPALLGSSHAIYLGSKAYTRWFRVAGKNES